MMDGSIPEGLTFDDVLLLPGKSSVDDSVRQAVVGAVQGADLNGVTGHVSFDQFGDTTEKVLTVYKVQGGAWKPVNTASFK